jgi:small subunit ribosomal protein S4
MVIKVHPKKVDFFKAAIAANGPRKVPSWIEFDADKLEAKIIALPSREENDIPVNEQLIVEFYSR